MVEIEPNVYNAVFPSYECLDTILYYLSAESTLGEVTTDPFNAPEQTYSAFVVSEIKSIVSYDFETDSGWTVQNTDLQDGAWERAVPNGGGSRGDPPSDFDGSGNCYVTDNDPGNSDVDGGPTRLISPTLDLSNATNPLLSYARWFTNDDQDVDRLDVEISNNDGSSWVLVESVPDTVGWFVQTIQIRDFIEPTSEMRLRFSVTDDPNNSVTEAALDAFEIFELICEDTGQIVLPTGFTIIRGRLVSGDVTDLHHSDNSYLVVQPGITQDPNEPPVWLELDGTAPTDTPTGLKFTLETNVSTPGVTQTILLYDYVAQAYEEVDSRTAPFGNDLIVEIQVDGDPSRFIEPETMAVKAQLTWLPGPLVIEYPWNVNIDQANWRVTP